MTYPPIDIQQLEKIYNIKLTELKKEDERYGVKRNSYQLDSNHQVVSLNLSGNEIDRIEGLENFKALTKLDLSGNNIVKIERLDHLRKLSELNLSKNKILKIEGINELIQLSELDISENKLDKIEELTNLLNLAILRLNNNQIATIEGIDNLKSLSLLALGSNKIQRIESLNQYNKLTGLYLNDNQITKITGLDSLNRLQVLDLSKNEISVIENLGHLVELKGLTLANNKITIIEKLETIPSLVTLTLAENLIKKIEGLDTLQNLSLLNLAYNKILIIEGLDELKQLTTLNISYNKLNKIEGLQNTTQLSKLYLANNNISKIDGLDSLAFLGELNIANNRVNKIEGLTKLAQLYKLDLSNNQISNLLDLDINLLRNLSEINLNYNPIKGTTISDLSDLAAIRGFIESLQNQNDTIENLCIKINILGSGRIGKTQLFKWLTKKTFKKKEPETHGTTVDRYEISEGAYKATLWDFGGQSYQHGTHSLFLRPTDLYIVLFRSRDDIHGYGYWLGASRSFAANKKNGLYITPLLLVQNVWSELEDRVIYPESKKIQHYQIDLDSIFAIDVKAFQTKEDKWRVRKDYFRQSLDYKIIEHAKSLGAIPKKFFAIKERLDNRSTTNLYIDKIFFRQEYALYFNDDEFAYLLQYLEFTGNIINFREKPSLSDFIFMGPQALSNWIYQTVLDKRFKNENEGILNYQFLEEKHGKMRAAIFKALMIEFNLLFAEPTFGGEVTGNLVVPQFLPENNSSLKKMLLELIPFTFSIRFTDFIYEGRIFNFISNYGVLAEDKSAYWKYGILFRKDEIRAIVYYDIEKRIIFAHVEEKNGSRLLCKEIMDFFVLKDYTLPHEEQYLVSELMQKMDKVVDMESFIGNYQPEEGNQLRLDSYLQYTWTRASPNTCDISIKANQKKLADDELKAWFKIQNEILTFLRLDVIDQRKRNMTVENVITGSYLSTNNKNYFDIIEALSTNGAGNPIAYCTLTKKNILLDYLAVSLLEMDQQKLPRVFISYSRQDLRYKEELKKHLFVLERFDLLKTWSCDQMKPGKWHDQIQQQLAEADIIIYMVSHHFMASDYIMEKEVKKGIELAESQGKKIICVLTGACLWQSWGELEAKFSTKDSKKADFLSTDLSNFQFLPYHQYKNAEGIAIREEIVALERWGHFPFDVINEAYNQIVRSVMAETK